MTKWSNQGAKARMLGRQNERNSSYVRLAQTSIFGFCFLSVCLTKSNCFSLIFSFFCIHQYGNLKLSGGSIQEKLKNLKLVYSSSNQSLIFFYLPKVQLSTSTENSKVCVIQIFHQIKSLKSSVIGWVTSYVWIKLLILQMRVSCTCTIPILESPLTILQDLRERLSAIKKRNHLKKHDIQNRNSGIKDE